ncbi:MAG: hypothetical protein Q9163_005124 [Psora crenata]
MSQSPLSERDKAWSPAQFARNAHTENQTASSESNYSVLILNVPIQDRSHFLSICRHARLRACADGGANRVRELGLTVEEEKDCVSANSSMKRECDAGTAIFEDHDQNSTDLMKTLKVLKDHHTRLYANNNVDIVVLGGLEGRADQALSQLHQLYLTSNASHADEGDVYLITSTSIIFLLQRGFNRIHTPVGEGLFTENIGIVPLAGPATLTTCGFEWNLADDELQFGRFISTSNHIRQDLVTVKTSEPLIFTIELA